MPRGAEVQAAQSQGWCPTVLRQAGSQPRLKCASPPRWHLCGGRAGWAGRRARRKVPMAAALGPVKMWHVDNSPEKGAALKQPTL